MTAPPPTCCDFFFRVLFGNSFGQYQPVSTRGDEERVTVALDVVRADGTVETVRTDLSTFLGHLKQKDLKESRQEKEWRTGKVVRQVKIPKEVWELLQSSPKHRSLYPRVRHAMEGYKRNKLALYQFLAILDSVQGNEKFHQQVLTRLPWSDFIEMARTSRKVESDGANALHWALCRDSESLTEDQIQEMLQVQPALARQTSDKGSLPIHLAAYVLSQTPNTAVLKRVIQAYPQGLEQIQESGMNPLHYALAAKRPHLETLRVILEACPAALTVKDRLGRNALHWAVQGEKVDARIIQFLLEQDSSSSNDLLKARTKEMGATPLQIAVLCNAANTELTKLLLSSWAEGAKEITRAGHTVLHFAVLSKGATLENVRLVHAAWPDALRFRDSKGMTPLHVAIRAGASMDVISFLLDASSESVFSEQVSQESLLHFIMFHPDVNVEITRRIYEAYPAAIREANAEGFMPIHLALYHGANEDVVKFLLDKWQGSVRVTAADGLTALHCAVHVVSERDQQKDKGEEGDDDGSSPNEAEALLGADMAVKTDDESNQEDCIPSPRSTVNVNVVKLIHRRWPDAIKSPATQLRVTPLVDAILSGASLEVIKYLYEEWPEGLTLRNQAIPPLHAAMTGRAPVNVVEFLIEKHPKSVWECSAPLGGTPLHVGVRHGAPLDCINLLLDKCGAARAARMKVNGNLLLHCALRARADVEIIERLVEALPGALLERDGEGIYPRDYALLYRADLQPRLKQLLDFRTNQRRGV